MMRAEGLPMTGADAVALDEWYVLGALEDMGVGSARRTTLLEVPLRVARPGDDRAEVARLDRDGAALPVRLRFGYVWTTLGRPAHDIFAIPEYDEPDRRNIAAASVGVRASAPRVVENFLDLGHLPIVHENYLGILPRAEIKPYDTVITPDNEVLATRCLVYQPQASLVATEGFDVEYVYRVPHPYCAVLYKSSAIDAGRMDVIAILVQPVDQEHSIAHMLASVLDDRSSDKAIRQFQQLIFGQDKPILENQLPRRLPLDPRAELPARVDASSLAYRRWLRGKGVRYGCLS